jgi:hypothetical protein
MQKSGLSRKRVEKRKRIKKEENKKGRVEKRKS